MPDTSCPRCGRAGFVRKERIIKANSATVGHYCGACQFEWAITEEDESSSSSGQSSVAVRDIFSRTRTSTGTAVESSLNPGR